MTSPILTKSFRVGSASIAGYLIVAATGTGNLVKVASAATDALIGAADEMGGQANGMVDIDVVGFTNVRFGGTVSFGDPLTSDANGKAVKAVPVEDAIVRVIGIAMCDAVDGDVGPYHVAPSVIATPEEPSGGGT